MGRAARIAFLLRKSMPAPCAGDDSDEPSVPNDVSKSEGEGVVARSADSSSGGAVGAGDKLMSAADAYSEVCRRVADFACDNPAYPAFVDLLLSEACRDEGDEDLGSLVGDKLTLSADLAAEGAVVVAATSSSGGAAAPGAGVAGAALAATSRIDGVLAGNQRQRYHWREWQNVRQHHGSATGSGGGPNGVVASTMASYVLTAESGTVGAFILGRGSGEGENDLQTLSPSVSGEGSRYRSSPTPSPVANELAVMGERALGAALTAVAKESGGKAAAAMLLSPPVHEKYR